MALTAGAIALIAQLAGGAAATGIQMLPNKYDKYNKNRIKELERLEELNMLGLTPEEQAKYFNQMNAQLAQQEKANKAMREQYLAQNATGGSALEKAMLAEEAGAMARQRGMEKIEELDQEKEARQRQEREDREAYRGQRQGERRTALAGFVGGAGKAVAGYQMQKVMLEGDKIPNAYIQQFSQTYGVSEDESRQLADFFAQNPQAMQLFMQSIGQK